MPTVKQPSVEDAYLFQLGLPRYALTGNAAYKPGLERIAALLREADDPHLRYPTIHVAGTNGKGSAASVIAAVLTASGLKVGLHTSPHLIGLEERMRIGSAPAGREWVTAATDRFRYAIQEVGASFFEATVLLSFLYFAEREADVAVVEVGLGGRYDATNVVRPDVAVITEIGLDHTDILGKTPGAIAAEKAGIVKPGIQVLTIARGEALDTIFGRARAVGAAPEDVRQSCHVADVTVRLTDTEFRLHTPVRDYEDLRLDLAGGHQLWNAVLGIRCAELYSAGRSRVLTDEAVRHGSEHVREYTGLRGRMEVISTHPTIIADNAHNPQGLEALFHHVQQFLKGRLHLALGLMKDKDANAVADLVAATGAHASVVALPGDRAMDVRDLHTLLKQRGVSVDICSSVSQAVETFRRRAEMQDVLLLTGSHLVVSDALEGRMAL